MHCTPQVVDKSTLDCLLCNPLAAHELCATVHLVCVGMRADICFGHVCRHVCVPIRAMVLQMLAPDGRFVVISLHDADYVATFVGLLFKLEGSSTIQRPVGDDILIIEFSKVACCADSTHEQRVQASADAWYQVANPLITPNREAAIRAAWACGAAVRTPSEAYHLLYESNLKAELPLSDFLGDVAESPWAHKQLWDVSDGLAFARASA